MKPLFAMKGKKEPATGAWDPLRETPVIRASICTGEQVAGFRDRATGKVREVMLVRTSRDVDAFRRDYSIDQPIEKIY